MSRSNLDQGRFDLRARCLRVTASRAEHAAGGRSERARHLARQARPTAGARRDPAPAPPPAAPPCKGACGADRSRPPAPTSMTRPRYITTTRSLTYCTTARSCAMNSIARPSERCRSSSRFSTCACTDTSSAETGSSATTKTGSTASARAMPIRWRCPPENSCG